MVIRRVKLDLKLPEAYVHFVAVMERFVFHFKAIESGGILGEQVDRHQFRTGVHDGRMDRGYGAMT